MINTDTLKKMYKNFTKDKNFGDSDKIAEIQKWQKYEKLIKARV